jgi:hypothetical protein
LVLVLVLALALVSVLVLVLALALVSALVLVLVLVLVSVLVSVLALVSVSAPALQTPAVYLRVAASVQESEVAVTEGVEQAQSGMAATRPHRVLQAEGHHLCQLRTTQYPARPSVLEISNSSQIVPLQCSEPQTREETKERASLFDMEFSQPLRGGPALEDYCFTWAESKGLICCTPSLRLRVGRSLAFYRQSGSDRLVKHLVGPVTASRPPDRTMAISS